MKKMPTRRNGGREDRTSRISDLNAVFARYSRGTRVPKFQKLSAHFSRQGEADSVGKKKNYA